MVGSWQKREESAAMQLLIRSLLAALLFFCSTCLAQPVGVLIAYDTVDGHTEQLANWIAEGARQDKETEVRLKNVRDVQAEDLLWADAILVGSPVHNGTFTSPVAVFLAEWPFEGRPLKNKVGGAFAAAKGASAGEEAVLLSILRVMLVLEMVTFGGDDWRSAFGVSYILDITAADPRALGFTKDKAFRLGQRAVLVARATKPLRATTKEAHKSH